jgi:hypothetical protein
MTIRAGDPKPAPQSERFERHRRRIFIFVITSYLLYTLYETFYQVQLAGDYYQALGVSPFADERAIKSRFRRLAAQYHPDKVGIDSGAEAYFLYLRRAQETLADPVKRFAYDRFGTDMVNWGDKKTMRDYLMTALTKSIMPQYIGGFVTMMVLNWLWWANWGRYVSTANSFQASNTQINTNSGVSSHLVLFSPSNWASSHTPKQSLCQPPTSQLCYKHTSLETPSTFSPSRS